MLIVFGGLPGVGKTTLARLTARERRAVYLRIDTIEQALRSSGMLAANVGPAGYMAAYALAGENLCEGRTVVADCVNPLGVTRAAWPQIAVASGARITEVEILCSDPEEHRRRLETRVADIAGLVPPDWAKVQAIAYEPWDGPRLVLDTAGRPVGEALAELRARLELP